MSTLLKYKVFISFLEPVNSISGTLWIDAANGDAYMKIDQFFLIASPNVPFISEEFVTIRDVKFDNSVQEVGQLFFDKNVPTGFDISSAVFNQALVVSSEDGSPVSIDFSIDGSKMYMAGSDTDEVHQYTLTIPFNISTSTVIGSFDMGPEDASVQSVRITDDGTKMYMCGTSSIAIHEYDLLTPGLVTSAVLNDSFSFSSQDNFPFGIFIKPDGTKMYMIGNINLKVYEYDLSIAFDVTTMVFLQDFFIGTQESLPRSVFFKSDGTKMYIIGESSDSVHEYDLSVAFDVTTAVFLQSFNVSAQDTRPNGLFFPLDGSKFYTAGDDNNSVYEYDLDFINFEYSIFLDDFIVFTSG